MMSFNPYINKEKEPNIIYYVDEWGMMRQRSFDWEPKRDDGIGDALWRTSFAYLIYHKEENSNILLEGIKKCFVKVKDPLMKKGYYYQAYRHPSLIDKKESTVSRDQVAAAFIALYLTGNHGTLKEIIPNIRWKLSNKFSQTLDFYLWCKAIEPKSKYQLEYSNLFLGLSVIIAMFVAAYNKYIRRILNIKEIDQKDFKSTPSHTLKFAERVLIKTMYPTYAFFLWAWQISTIKDTKLKFLTQSFLLFEVESSNYVLRKILNDPTLSEKEIINYQSMLGIRWNNRLDKSSNDSMRIMSEEEKKYNDLDGDMLKFVFSN